MAFFEQAAVLATAWANEESLKALGARCSLIEVSSKKLTRRILHAYSVGLYKPARTPYTCTCMISSSKPRPFGQKQGGHWIGC